MKLCYTLCFLVLCLLCMLYGTDGACWKTAARKGRCKYPGCKYKRKRIAPGASLIWRCVTCTCSSDSAMSCCDNYKTMSTADPNCKVIRGKRRKNICTDKVVYRKNKNIPCKNVSAVGRR